jgi:pSer/pThr/pTyr-binding forkhead associated (FHA) protein
MLSRRTKLSAVPTKAKSQSGESPGFPTLRLLRNGAAIQELKLDGPHLLIGRADDNDMSIPSSYVSQYHILLVRRDESTILIDLNSTNGTYVNSELVRSHVLANNDVITVDDHSMFETYCIEYREVCPIGDGAQHDAQPVDPVIAKALARFENLLIGGDTDLLPKLSQDVPTVVGFVDDR